MWINTDKLKREVKKIANTKSEIPNKFKAPKYKISNERADG
jgi:hypothetical protein